MPDAMQTRAIRDAMIDNYNLYAQGLDSKDWAMVRDCFADEVFIDYGDLSDPTGSPDVARNSDDWIPILQGVINGFDITRHIITNHRPAITDTSMSCTAYLLADHVIFADPAETLVSPRDVITVVGEYTNWYAFDGMSCKICRSRLVINYSSGNMALFERAVERAAHRGQPT